MISTDWQPSASIETLHQRANLLARLRDFFSKRQLLEVETPLLSQFTVTDRYIDSIKTSAGFLQTSPEYAMKRLLAAGSGPIFQISKAFRQEEKGHQHNPEFSILEWYQPDYDHHQLMDELSDLLIETGSLNPALRYTYQSIFIEYCNIDPLQCATDEILQQLNATPTDKIDRDTSLQLLFSEKIEPHLGHEAPVFIYNYPASQAALATVKSDDPLVAERFELFIDGTEIANGFHELTDADEQYQRFKADQAYREQQGKIVPSIDDRFMAALKNGLPACAGVALGIDRLLMCLLKKKRIQEVIAFDSERA